ncbi:MULTISPECIES: hypothetical protein [unclassified Streptomyces]|uniref:hypothetical protein n=1 Tax=unclassified Streptomyces TaxID=2593676 RepID=UPI002366E8DA|nr:MULTISPECIES: hypothetical protein [unclassified Streptomyces]MDF3143383.1 hypothetical protein [Streptomyces sp. T21Q-yed]WDF42415.1 hypothetical protein PBV52_39270 [Streptomyces sp. T12]
MPQSTPSAGAPPHVSYDVTRYLCAAMHTDIGLARKAVARIVHEPRRAAASSPGVDLGCVLRHALAARTRQRRRDVVLLLLLLVMVITLPFTQGVSLFLGLLVAWVIVATELVSVHYGVVARKLKRENFDPRQSPRPPTARDAARLEAIELRDRGNVVVSSRFEPFVGHGETYRTWSFALNTGRAEAGKQVIPFTIHDLNAHISARVGALELPGMDVADVLLVNGADLLIGIDDRTRAEVLRNLGGPPGAQVSDALLRELREDGKGRARPYLAVRVTGWSGELVITLFLRCALLSGRDIAFIEGSNCLLAPVREKYRTVDRLLDSPTFRQWCRLVGEAGARTPILLVRAPFALLRDLFAPLERHRAQRRQERSIRMRTFDYGSKFSLREQASDRFFHRYFQSLDRELYAKTIEHRVLDALVQFLEDHNIDSSDLIQRQTTIYNSGLFAGRDISIKRSSVRAGGGHLLRNPQPVRQR